MGEGGIKNNREASTFFSKHALSTPPTTQATEGRIQGEKGRRPNAGGESTTNIGILKGLYCLPATISVPATCWASRTLLPTLRTWECGHSSALSFQGIKVFPGADSVAEGLRVRGRGLSSIPCGGGWERGPFLTPTMGGCLEEKGRVVSS